MAATDYVSLRRLGTFLSLVKQWVLSFVANRNTQTMSDVTVNTGISGTATIGKSITIHTASGAQTANVMNADMIVGEKPTTNKDLASKAPTVNLVDSMVMDAISDKVENVELRHGDTYDLPYDAQVEYLESTGTQYIQLNFGFDITDEVDAYISVDTSHKSDKYMNSPQTWNNKNNRFGMGVHNNGKYTCAIGNTSTNSSILQPLTINDGNIHHWTYANSVFQVVDVGVSYTFAGTFGETTTNLKLFYGYSSNTKGKIASYKHTKGGLLICDFIPVRVGQVGYMYDRVSKTLFGNEGTGSFILGNDVDESDDLEQTDLYVDNDKVGTLITSYAPSASARPYVAPSWEALTNSLSDKVDKVASTDNAVVRFNGTGGAIQNSGVTIDDSNNITAAKFVKSGGTASQFLKADGSVDSNTYLTQHQDISGKQDTLVSGTNIKTINGESVLGSGNLTISSGGGNVQADWDESDESDDAYIRNKPTLANVATSGSYNDLSNKPTIPSATSTTPKMNGTAAVGSETAFAKGDHVHPSDTSKQDTLVSGTNIKTINSNSIIGSGDLTLALGDENVQSDWNQTSSTADDYIKNKPTIPSTLAELTEDSSHKVVSQTSITSWNGKADKTAQVNHGTSDTTYTITPNVLHVWGEVTALNLTLGTGESGVVNEYMFQFYSGNTPTTLTLPNSVIWVQPLTTQAGKTYQVSIVNNLAAYITDGMAAAESSGGTPTYATQAWVTALIDANPTANSSNVPSSGGTYAMIEGGYYYN